MDTSRIVPPVVRLRYVLAMTSINGGYSDRRRKLMNFGNIKCESSTSCRRRFGGKGEESLVRWSLGSFHKLPSLSECSMPHLSGKYLGRWAGFITSV
jgi:hypothetical protein